MSEVPGIDYFDDAFEPVVQEPQTLERLMTLAENARDLAAEIVLAETALEELKGKHEKIVRRQIPTLMENLGMDSFKLKTGETVEVKGDVKASISDENKPKAWEWLEQKEFDGIIKTTVSVPYGKGEFKVAQELVVKLAAMGVVADLGRSVHPMTLKSFVKERLEAGDLPSDMLEVFGVFEFKEAKFKSPRVSKSKK